MASKDKKYIDALVLLKDYNGNNPYILMIKKDVVTNKNLEELNDYKVEYILKNYNFKPLTINKITKITQEYGLNRKEAWGLDFIPEKLKIITLLGETERAYHCYVRYRQSVPPAQCFIPKKAIINNFLVPDYKDYAVDFDKYDQLSTQKDSNRKLMPHQKEGVKFLLARKKCILADSMGLGKTATLSVAAIEGNFDSVLIICPASLKTNWKNELMWYVNEEDITIIDGFNDKKKNELEEFLGYEVNKSGKSKEELLDEAKNKGKWKSNNFVIVNFDILDEFYNLTRKRNKKTIEENLQENPLLNFIYGKKSLIIIDEAHKLSNSTSIRYKIIKNLIKKGDPDSIYLSTGTPVTNNPLNLYYLLNLIENDITGDYQYYINHYCDAKKIYLKGEFEKWSTIYFKNHNKFGWKYLTEEEKVECKEYIDKHARQTIVANGEKNLDELSEKVSHIYLRRVKEDLDEMPKKSLIELHYMLNKGQKAEYDRLVEEYITEKKAENPNKELNMDLLEGGIYRNYISIQTLPYTKTITDKLIKEGKKVVIMCCFDEELYALKEYYDNKSVIYNGKCSLKQKDEAIEKFMNNDECMVFIGNIIAAGVGITLTSSYNMVFNSFDYVPSDFSQACDRIYRKSQTKDCNIYVQLFDETHIEHVWETVIKKQNIFDQIIKKEDEKQ